MLILLDSYSLLPALCSDGIIYCDIKVGAYNGPSFVSYIEALLQHMSPWPEPKSVLVMDNCAIHHVDTVRYLCEERYVFFCDICMIRLLIYCSSGVKLYYLPPYSPDLNPIEEAFSYIKSYIQRHGDEFRTVLRSDDEVAIHGYLYSALGMITAEKARGWMHHSGYW
jgi:transposase